MAFDLGGLLQQYLGGTGVSSFYAEHPTLVKTLGSAALSIALAKMAEYQRA